MKELIAIHEVQYDDEKGNRKVAEPGKSFSVDEDTAEVLVAAGAAAVDGEAATVGKPLDKMNKVELVAVAEGLEIEGAADLTKAQLLDAIKAKQEDPLV